jgi:hypothetical protein
MIVARTLLPRVPRATALNTLSRLLAGRCLARHQARGLAQAPEHEDGPKPGYTP